MLQQYWLAIQKARQETLLRSATILYTCKIVYRVSGRQAVEHVAADSIMVLRSSGKRTLQDRHTCSAEVHMQAACAAMQIADLLTQLVTDTDVTMEVSSFAAVALGLTFVGTCHAASVEAMLQVSTHAPSSNLQQRTSACKFDHHSQVRKHDVFFNARL